MTKKLVARKPKGNLVEQIDAAIALLSHLRALAASEGSRSSTVKHAPAKKTTKRVLSKNAREAIAAAQRKRWAKVRREKKRAARAAPVK
jgi:hypothetical protein